MRNITVTLLLGIALAIPSCSRKKINTPLNESQWASVISSFSTGFLSVESPVRVILAREIPALLLKDAKFAEDGGFFELEPAVKGTSVMTDNRSIEFRPEKDLEPGKEYTIHLNLQKLFSDLADDMKTFTFKISTLKQNFEVNIENTRSIDFTTLSWYKITGTIRFADVLNGSDAEKILSVSQQNNERLALRWNHNSTRYLHAFEIDSVRRSDTEDSVKIAWDGTSLQVQNTGFKYIKIPSKNNFTIVDYRVVKQEDEYISVTFSDPLLSGQLLTGLVKLGSTEPLKFSVDANQLRIYPPFHLSGTQTLNIYEGVKNIIGRKLSLNYTYEIAFDNLKPQVRFTSSGIILPTSTEKISLPFEAVSLKAVDIKIMKIFENNISQFLQVNTLGGDEQLYRVGQTVFKKTMELKPDNPMDYYKWTRYFIDLDNKIFADKGAIYRIFMKMQKKHAIYPCGDTKNENESMETVSAEAEDASEENESSYWDYYYDYSDDYSWDQRDNPCHNTYYSRSERKIAKNILLSDIGITAKKGLDNRLIVFINNLGNTETIPGAEVEIYDFQNQLLGKATTDNNGKINFTLTKKPYLLVAKNGEERGYLRLDNGTSLSLSRFDVDGAGVPSGLKGFIYGERGVWRPGDSLFLTFILEDKMNKLPPNHPVHFELYNPLNQLVKTTPLFESVKGTSSSLSRVYAIHTFTNEDAPTGNWTAKFKVGGTVFEKSLKIETVMPNRLKIKLDFGATEIMSDTKNIKCELSSTWLHGATARNLKADMELFFTPAKTTFPKFSEFSFDDPMRKCNTESNTVFEGHLNENGKAEISFETPEKINAAGKLMANFRTRVFEDGGAFSQDRYSIPYHPYPLYVGVRLPKGDKERGMLLTDVEHTADIAVINSQGIPVSLDKVVVQFYKISWRWWWEKGEEDFSDYSQARYLHLLKSDTISVKNGTGQWKFTLKYPEWGRYLVRVCDEAGGHCAGKIVYMDWPGWAGRAQKDNPGGATMLVFSADKEKYKVGEDVTLSIPAGKTTRALLSLENGSKIIKADWIPLAGETTHYKFTVTPEMVPNFYAHVTLLQPHQQTLNDLPIRMYGLIPIFAEDPATKLKPILKMNDELRPESKVKITVSEQSGLPMVYTLAVVDEGLLDLTRFKTPEPWEHFYAREALGVKTWDMYDDVIGAFSQTLEKLLALGGDDGIDNSKLGKKTQRFKPVVKFFGPFLLEKGEQRVTEFIMPQYIGSVRTMVVAAHQGAYGSTEKTTPVRNPLMILATAPRVLGPEEETDLPVSVFAMTEKVRMVSIEVQTDKNIQVLYEKNKVIQFSSPGDELVIFRLKAGVTTGSSRIKVIATSGNEKAVQEFDIPLRNPNPKITDVYATELDANQSWEKEITYSGMSGTNKCMIELSVIPPLNLENRLNFLIHYPYGCVEQTTSSAFPQLFVDALLDLSKDKKSEIQYNVNAAIQRIYSFQNSEGGFSYWPGIHEGNDWCTSYAGHFLLEAEKKGYAVSGSVLNQFKNYQRRVAQSWSPDNKSGNDLIQAYRLFTLAMVQQSELGAMNRMREMKNISNQAKWRLALAYKLAGQPEAANSLMQKAGDNPEDYKEQAGYTYGSTLRDKAMLLETVAMMGNKEKANKLIKEISESMSKEGWYSTQTTAFCLLAAAKYLALNPIKGNINTSVTWNGTNAKEVSSQYMVKTLPLVVGGETNGKILLKNNSGGLVYARLISTGVPATGDQTRTANDILLSVTYQNLSGTEINPEDLEQGVDFMASVTIKNPGNKGDYKNIALNQIFPSGWEIRNTRTDPAGTKNISVPDYQDFRDDRVYTFFGLKKNESKTFTIRLNSAHKGKYYLPTVTVEDMYDGGVNARVPGKWVRVGMERGM
ncbi:MAG: hypothetical protein A3H98_04145 [Bacteroidetes bacterium RIFCSPLOWO2_02_FULL_36_8]|nr:MAG: hypothetical protein A3H98_04145 [Bacteroidetes bacterium RIFCSPLOWO2_02_FULL_36_8]OFY70370.1 MAG: hypothetical protein A3G23_09595 [Bacteroidetes bacterium RIFCSPLOWO2_12_FULL_37_12]